MNITTRLKVAAKVIAGQTKSAVNAMLLDPSTYKSGTAFGNDFWLFGNDGVDKYFSYTNAKSSLTAYNDCPPVAAILNRKAQAYINGKMWVLNTIGKGKAKESDKEAAVKIRKLMLQPNKLQSGKQFEAQAYMYQQLFGYAVVLMMKPFGFANVDAKAMWLIPNWMCDIEESKELFYNDGVNVIKRITISYKGVKTDLPLDSVFIIKDFRPSFSSVYLPESRIKSLSMPINNVIGAYESRNVIINKRGPGYVVSNSAKDQVGTVPMRPEEKEEAQKAFSQYGLRKGQSNAIITSASIAVTPVGFNVAELKLMEEVTESSKAICDGFGFPAYLMGLIDPTFNNQSAADKGLYQNTIIPEAESNYEQWNALFATESFGIRMEKDFAHITVLQEDAQTKATARNTLGTALDREFKNNFITYNRVLELLGEDTTTWGNIYYRDMVAQGFLFGDTNKPISVNEQGQLVAN